MTLRRTIRHTLAAAGLLLAAAQAARPATAVPPSAGADGRSVPVREAAAGRTPQRSGGMQRAATGRPAAERTVGIAFYDVDRLYDTLPALFYDDEEYTPRGRLRWTAERYARKIRNTAAVIDSMALPVVALRGVENERVVRDLAAACRGDSPTCTARSTRSTAWISPCSTTATSSIPTTPSRDATTSTSRGRWGATPWDWS